MLSAAGRGLRDGSRQERAERPIKRYTDLSESNISLLTRIFSNLPPYNLASTSPRHEVYMKITLEQIEALPAALVTPPPNRHFFGLVRSDNNRCLVPDPRKSGGKPFKELCELHSRLQCPLVHSILRFVLDEISWYMPKLFNFSFEPEHRLLFDRLINVTSLYMRPSAFEEHWGRPPPLQWERQGNKCAACMLARIGSDCDVVVALGAIYRARIQEETYNFHLRTFWYDEWMRSIDVHNGEHLVEKSRALGSAMKRVVQKAREEKEKLDEIDPDESWAKKKPAATQLFGSGEPYQHQPNASVAGKAYMGTSNHCAKQSRFSDEEALAKLGGTWIPPKGRQSNAFAHTIFDSDDAKIRSSSSTGSLTLVDDNYMNLGKPTETEEVHVCHTKVHQPAYMNVLAATYASSAHALVEEAMPTSSFKVQSRPFQSAMTTPKRETVFLDSTPSGGFERKPRVISAALDWGDVRAHLNRSPPAANDVPELSDSSSTLSSETSACTDSIAASTFDEAIDNAYIEDDDDCPNTSSQVPDIYLDPALPPRTELPLTPDVFKQPLEQDLRPPPSIDTACSASVYSFYEGPYGERYDTPLPSPPKPLHVRKISDETKPRAATPQRDSFILPPPPPRPDIDNNAKVTGLRPESRSNRTSHRLTPSISHGQPCVSRHGSTARVSQNSQSAPRRPSAPVAIRTGLAIGGSEFRRMLSTQEEEDDYVDDRRSEWMRQFEWEQPHPATSRVFF